MSDSGEWYYAIGNDRFGPVPLAEVQQRIGVGELGATSLVWKEGMPDWAPLSSVPELATALPPVDYGVLPQAPTDAAAPPGASPLQYYAGPVGVVQYAGFWTRFVAALIDSLIMFVPNCIIGSILTGVFSLIGVGFNRASGGSAIPPVATAFSWVVGIVIRWLYFALFECSGTQATLGKMAVGIVVTDLEGRRLTFGKATARFFGKFLSAAIFMVGFFMAGFTERKQALHDLLAGTLVIIGKRKSGEPV